MANIKRFSIDWTASGLTVYGIIVREQDAYMLNDADGTFAASPADPYVSFTEHPLIKGRYILSESRTAWDDGSYTIAIYSQAGGSPSPSADGMIGTGMASLFNDLIRTTIAYPSGVSGITLADIVSRTRSRLDDMVEPYLWSNNDITDCLNEVINELCRDMPMIEDSTGTTVCRYSITKDDPLVNLNSRITILKKARLASQNDPLLLRNAHWMDANYPGWESSASGLPTILITEGVGTGKARIYPPPNANDTLWVSVYRLQLVDMFWATDQTYQPEIPAIYHDKLFNGILWKAYSKQDVDTLDLKKVAAHERMWLRDKEEIRRAVLKSRLRAEVVGPHPGWV